MLHGRRSAPTRAALADSFPGTSGFTLTELLVVIAVLALLAAFLFPAFARARETARQTVCISNMHQITCGILMYAQDWDDRCPLYYATLSAVTPGNRNPGHSLVDEPPYQYWTELVSSYIQTQRSHNLNTASRVFFCPDAPDDAAALTRYGLSNRTSYGLSDNWVDWYCPDDCNNGTGQPHTFTEAVAPASTVLLAETMFQTDTEFPGFALANTPIDGGNTGYYYANCDAAGQPAFSAARMFVDLSWRHQQAKSAWCAVPPSDARINIAYADGHVRSASIAQLSDFRQWSILQGSGDVGCHPNWGGDGTNGCWYP